MSGDLPVNLPRFLRHLKRGLTGLAVSAVALAIFSGWQYTAEQLFRDLYHIATHLHDSEDDKLVTLLSSAGFNDDVMTALFSIKQTTPDDAEIGVVWPSPVGPFHWSLLYPRRVVLIRAREDFERLRPTHLLVERNLPEYLETFPQVLGGWKRSGEKGGTPIRIIQVSPMHHKPAHPLLRKEVRPVMILVEALSPLALGGMLILAIAPQWKRGGLVLVALAFLIGLGIHAFLLFTLSLVGIPLTTGSVLAFDSLAIGGAVATLWYRRRVFGNMFVTYGTERIRKTKTEKVVLLFLCLLLFVQMGVNFYWPIDHVDPVASFDYRAKAIAQQGTVAIWQLFSNIGWLILYYPFFVTMVHAHHYLLGGMHAKVYGTLMLGALLIIFYSRLKARGCSTFRALVFALVLGGNPLMIMQSQQAGINFPQMVYATIGLFFLLDYVERQGTADLFLSAFSLGLTGWCRNESPVLLAVACFVVLIAGRLPLRARLYGLTVLIGIYGVLALPYQYFFHFVLDFDLVKAYNPSGMSFGDAAKFLKVLFYFTDHSIDRATAYLAVPWLLVLLADWPWRQEARPLLLTTGLMIMAWIGIFYVINPVDWVFVMNQYRSGLRWYTNLLPFYLAFIAESTLARSFFGSLELPRFTGQVRT